ncbi:MAG: DUF2510 domain-containing protein [Coriobacteriales bacterium]|nr:DUF2510 domain-containing protein [Coriobacteriales bacterium]
MTDNHVSAGWYADPSGDTSRLRYWDGVQWTEQYQSAEGATGAASAGSPAQGGGYAQPAYVVPTAYHQGPAQPPQGALASMVLGIVSLAVLLVGFCVPFSGTISIGSGIAGIVLAVKSRKIARSGQATAGLVMSIIALSLSVLWIAVLILGIIVFSSLMGSVGGLGDWDYWESLVY